MAIDAALGAEDHPMPESQRDAHTAVSRAAGWGRGYFYSHQDYSHRQELLPEALRGARFHQPIRPQGRCWLDRGEAEFARLGELWNVWLAEPPEGGEVPMDLWCSQLECSREALARALPKLAQGGYVLERKPVARAIAGEQWSELDKFPELEPTDSLAGLVTLEESTELLDEGSWGFSLGARIGAAELASLVVRQYAGAAAQADAHETSVHRVAVSSAECMPQPRSPGEPSESS